MEKVVSFQTQICKEQSLHPDITLIFPDGSFFTPFVFPRLIKFCNSNYSLVDSLFECLPFNYFSDWDALLDDLGYIENEGLCINDVDFMKSFFSHTLN